MEVRFINNLVNAMIWFLLGMTTMAKIYCVQLNITEGAMYIGTWTFVCVGITAVMIKLFMYFDPSFKE